MPKMTQKTDRVTRLLKKPAPYRTKMMPPKKQAFACIDGPLKGVTLWLTSACTGVIEMGGKAFQYVAAEQDKPILKVEFK